MLGVQPMIWGLGSTASMQWVPLTISKEAGVVLQWGAAPRVPGVVHKVCQVLGQDPAGLPQAWPVWQLCREQITNKEARE